MTKPKLTYMPEESTPTITTEGNRKAVAYLEVGEDTDYYGKLFAGAEETAAERDRLLVEKKELLAACQSALPFLKGLRDGLMDVGPEHDPTLYEQRPIATIEALITRHGGGR
jgi:hypothetical protein